MVCNEKVKLNNGLMIPRIAAGTWCIEDKDVEEVVKNSIEVGYRHIDTAQGYWNEEGVGRGIKASGIDRSEIFITSKILAETKSYDEARKSIDESLKKLSTDYLDLMLIHCPQPWSEYNNNPYRYEKENIEVFKAMIDAMNEGKIKSIGVSNFNIHDLENIINNTGVVPCVNQVHCNVFDTPLELIDFCNKNNIKVEAYCPNGHGNVFDKPLLIDMAKKYNVTVAQLSIRYDIQLGCIVLPKTVNVEHMKDNLKLDFEISKEDMEILRTKEK